MVCGCVMWFFACSTPPSVQNTSGTEPDSDSVSPGTVVIGVDTLPMEIGAAKSYPDPFVRRLVQLPDTMFGTGVEFEMKWAVPMPEYNLLMLSRTRKDHVYEILATTDKTNTPVDHLVILSRFKKDNRYFFVSHFIFDSLDPDHLCIQTI